MTLVYGRLWHVILEIGITGSLSIVKLITRSDARDEPKEGDCIKQHMITEMRDSVAFVL